MVYAPDLCQVLWPGHAGHSRLFRPLALDVLRRHTHGAGIGKSGGVGISFPKASLDAARVPEEERLRLRM